MKELFKVDNDKGLCAYYCAANAVITLLDDYDAALKIVNKDNYRNPLPAIGARGLCRFINKETKLKAKLLKGSLVDILDDEVLIIPNGSYSNDIEHAIMIRKEGYNYYAKDPIEKSEFVMSIEEINESIKSSLTKKYLKITKK